MKNVYLRIKSYRRDKIAHRIKIVFFRIKSYRQLPFCGAATKFISVQNLYFLLGFGQI